MKENSFLPSEEPHTHTLKNQYGQGKKVSHVDVIPVIPLLTHTFKNQKRVIEVSKFTIWKLKNRIGQRKKVSHVYVIPVIPFLTHTH